jgi:hypothetical protein
MDAVSQRLHAEGFVVVADVIEGVRCDMLASHLQGFGKSRAGSRALLMQPWCQALASNLRENALLRGALPLNAVAVQCTAFAKSPTKNWLVSLHQDLGIPVKHRVDNTECTGWSEKEGQCYVQPPARVLEHLVAIRMHIDECPAESGALRVVPGSHAFGRVDAAKVDELRTERGETVVPVARGGVLLMRPLLLHASSKATEPTLRRVLHFVFGPQRLPLGLEWQWAV